MALHFRATQNHNLKFNSTYCATYILCMGPKFQLKKVVERPVDRLKSIFTIFFFKCEVKSNKLPILFSWRQCHVYLNYKLKYRLEIPHNDYRNSLLFQHFVIKKKITSQYWVKFFYLEGCVSWPPRVSSRNLLPSARRAESISL